jgi:hypothetical protein
VETPEPRYVLECFPVVIALGTVVVGGWFGQKHSNEISPQ